MADDLMWLRQGPYYWTGPGGCQVAACRLGPATAARWRFTAWGAEEMPELTYWQWQAADKPPVVYARGEPVARRRPWLGVHDTAAAARAACLAWLAGREAAPAGPGGVANVGEDLSLGGQAEGLLGAPGAPGADARIGEG